MANKEQVSALMDGESIDVEVISDLESDAQLSRSWQNYHMIGDTLRGEEPVNPQWDIAASVAAALDQEPAHRPHAIPVDDLAPTPNEAVDEQPTPRQARWSRPAWLSQLGQVAIAASVSLAVVVGVQQYSGIGGEDASITQPPVLQTVPFAGSVEPVSLTQDSLRNSVEPQLTEQELMQQRQKINAMMQDYELQLRFLSGEQVVTE
jgi:sigma-E factor negative regulatory protein RseA